MNKQEIMNLLYGAYSQYAADVLELKKEIQKGNPFTQEFRELTNKYNTAINKKCCLEEILDIIEESENKSN